MANNPPPQPPALIRQYGDPGDFESALNNYIRYLQDIIRYNYNIRQINAVLRIANQLRNNYRENNIEAWDNGVNDSINNFQLEGIDEVQINEYRQRLREYDNNILNNNIQLEKKYLITDKYYQKYIKYKSKYIKLKYN